MSSESFKIMTAQERADGIAPSILHLIGNTPMVYLSDRVNDTKAKIALKLEGENPMASVKDRLALSIITNLEKEGKIIRGKSILVEATSGNTGIALAQVAAVLGYKCIITMPEQMSQERRCLLKIFNCDVVLTPAKFGMKGANYKAKDIVANTPDAVMCNQFSTEYNALIHRETTGPEIWAQTHGEVDFVVSGVGTGGTVTGLAQFLKEKKPGCKVYAIEPDESAVINGEKPGPHAIQGIGAGFVPDVLKVDIIDGALRIKSPEAHAMARRLPMTDGLFCGMSAGAAVLAALEVARRPEAEGKLVVAIIPSFGERYLSTAMFQGLREEVLKWPTTPEAEIQALLDA